MTIKKDFFSWVERTPIVFLLLDAEGRIERWNSAAETLFGYGKDEIIGSKWSVFVKETFHEEFNLKMDRIRNRVVKSLPIDPLTIKAERKDGTVFDAEVSFTEFCGGSHSPILVVIREISEDISSEEFRQSIEQRYCAFRGSMGELVHIVDMELRIRLFNAKFIGLTKGYRKESDVIGKALFDVFPLFPIQTFVEYFQVVESGVPLRIEEVTGIKETRLVTETLKIPIPCSDGIKEVLTVVRDITKMKDTERELRQNEEKYRNLFHFSNDSIFIHDLKGHIRDVNQKALQQFGFERSALLDLNIRDVHPESALAASEQAFETIVQKGNIFFEIDFKRKDGDVFPAEVSSSLFQSGDEILVQGIVRDLTERKCAEEERRNLESRLRQVQRLESLGTLAGGIAHGFNNLLSDILGRASLMLLDADPTYPYFQHLKFIEETVKKASDLSNQLLGFAGGGKYDVKPLDLNDVLMTSSELFGRTRKGIQFQRALEPNLWTVRADRNQVEQMLTNLYINAWQAMSNGGTLRVGARNVYLTEQEVIPHQVKSGRFVEISIADNGVGMDEITKQRVFEPFFTTKGTGKGTGLGLSSVYGIIKNHGGVIELESQIGMGTTFKIYLPASDDEKVEKNDIPLKAFMGGETVLLVDDDPSLLDIGKQLLEKTGYRVLIACNGSKAIEVFEANHRDIDVVILDMIMPDMDGGATYERLKAIQPEIKALLSSGFSLDKRAAEILKKGCNGFIQKPFTMKEFLKKLRDVLESE